MTKSQINDVCCGVKWNDQEIVAPICECQGEGMLSAPKEKTEKRIFTQKGKGKRQGGVSKRGGEF